MIGEKGHKVGWEREEEIVESWKNDQTTLKKNSQRASKKVSLKGTDVQRLLETLRYRTKSPVHSNKQCTKERERLFRKKKTVIKTQGKWAKWEKRLELSSSEKKSIISRLVMSQKDQDCLNRLIYKIRTWRNLCLWSLKEDVVYSKRF